MLKKSAILQFLQGTSYSYSAMNSVMSYLLLFCGIVTLSRYQQGNWLPEVLQPISSLFEILSVF